LADIVQPQHNDNNSIEPEKWFIREFNRGRRPESAKALSQVEGQSKDFADYAG
jgi:hypothetical protein